MTIFDDVLNGDYKVLATNKHFLRVLFCAIHVWCLVCPPALTRLLLMSSTRLARGALLLVSRLAWCRLPGLAHW